MIAAGVIDVLYVPELCHWRRSRCSGATPLSAERMRSIRADLEARRGAV